MPLWKAVLVFLAMWEAIYVTDIHHRYTSINTFRQVCIQLLEISQTSDGGYIASGYTSSFGAGNRDLWILKLGPNGELTFDYGSGASVTITNTTGVASTCTVTNTTSTVGSVSHGMTAVYATTTNTNFSVDIQATYSYGWY